MTFERLDRRMRVFETARDRSQLPGILMVARIDRRVKFPAKKSTILPIAVFMILKSCTLNLRIHVIRDGQGDGTSIPRDMTSPMFIPVDFPVWAEGVVSPA